MPIGFPKIGLIKSVTNLVAFLDFPTHLFCTRSKTDPVYFDFSNSFDIIPHGLLQRIIYNYGLYSVCLNQFRSCLTHVFDVHTSLCYILSCTSRIGFRDISV
jgi:hypothetical protein